MIWVFLQWAGFFFLGRLNLASEKIVPTLWGQAEQDVKRWIPPSSCSTKYIVDTTWDGKLVGALLSNMVEVRGDCHEDEGSLVLDYGDG